MSRQQSTAASIISRSMLMAARIVVVEDMAVVRQLIGSVLRAAGFTNIAMTSDGIEALEEFENTTPDLVLLDMNMPRMNGEEVCKHMRNTPNLVDVPILVQTASETVAERNVAFRVGASDFVAKPFNAPELVARVTLHLENRLLIKQLSNYRARIDKELQRGVRLQKKLLPSCEDLDAWGAHYGLSLQHFYMPSSEMGGDTFGFQPLSDDQLGFYMIDVSGHGIGAAFDVFRAVQSLKQIWQSQSNPADILEDLHLSLRPIFEDGQFLTAICGVFDRTSGKVTYASAAQPNPMFIAGPGPRKAIRQESRGRFIGIGPEDISFETHKLRLAPGECLLLYSDALIETSYRNAAMLGEEGLQDLINRLESDTHSESFFDRLVRFFMTDYRRGLDDDLTLISLTRNG